MTAAPLTPPDCDVRDYPRMLLDLQRLFGSEFNTKASAVPLAWMAGIKLWGKAFHQFPAGSLPSAEVDLCRLAEMGSDLRTFRKVRPLALRGWAEASDGRLYHRVVAEVVLEAWVDKLMLRLKSGAGNGKRHAAKGYAFDPAPVVLSLETAGVYLATLNPRSRALEKIRRRSEMAPSPVRSGSHREPSGAADGAHSDSETAPFDVPVGSQAKAKAQDSSLRSEDHAELRGRDAVRRADVASLQIALMEAGGEAIADIAVAPAIANLSPILNLLEPGAGPSCDLDRDVLPVIRRLCAGRRRRSINTWNYFTRAVVEARDARLAGAPAQIEVPHDASPRSSVANDRDDRLGSMFRGALAALDG